MNKYFNYIFYAALILVAAGAFPGVQFLRFAAPAAFILIIYISRKEISEDSNLRMFILLVLGFGIWSFLTAIWSYYPLISLARAVYYTLMSLAAVTGGYLWIKENPRAPFGFLFPLNLIIIFSTLISFLFPETARFDYFTGLTLLKGFTAHPNTLGALILFTLPVAVIKFFNSAQIISGPSRGEKRNKNKMLFYGILLLVNLIILGMTFSRASILALSASASLILIYLFSRKALFALAGLGLLFFMIILTFPSTKIILNKDSSNYFGNRTILWQPSLQAAKEGGFTGLGYGVSHPDIIVDIIPVHYKYGNYDREKGNSQLALIEETGIIGFLLFYLPLFYLLFRYRFYRFRQLRFNEAALTSFLAGLLIHSFFEGWQVGVTSPFLFLYLILIGVWSAEGKENIPSQPSSAQRQVLSPPRSMK